MCRSVDVKQAVLAKNDGLAAALRADLARRGVTVVNLLSSPGSGKTELLGRVLARAVGRGVPVAALTADLATENDARRLARSGAPVQQVLTDGLCHLEARQVRARLEGWLPADTALLFVENVGNLVCPASYDLGETLRIVLMAVTEGEDKPLKYPTAFGSAHLVVVTKTDLAEAAGFDEAAFREHVRRVNPGVEIVRTCARTGDGVDALLEHALAARDGAPPHRPPLAPRPHTHDDEHEYGGGLERDHSHGGGPQHGHSGAHPRAHGHASAPDHGEEPAHAHTAVHGHADDHGHDDVPEHDHGAGPVHGDAGTHGHSAGPVHGDAGTHGHSAGPGHGHSAGPGHGRSAGPDHGHSAGPGHGRSAGPDHGHGQEHEPGAVPDEQTPAEPAPGGRPAPRRPAPTPAP